MIIVVGTKNQIKLDAVRETIDDYELFRGFEVKSYDAPSQVADQPKSLDETVSGAKNRAESAFKGLCLAKGDLGIGIEDGLIVVPGSLTGMMNICCCSFCDGCQHHLGFSAGFEYPPEAIALVGEGLDINQAFYKMKLTDNPKIGSSIGAIGILTKGRWLRKDTVKQALIAALVQIDNKGLYCRG